ncbi:hypothetical protein LSG31_07180 [Fodinisporobacter ferrooxydans]|uniref:Metallo-beta-lactamase domain-containing protein n=1 Tax=Fodinisporobacter ferrooxydans TaxID=2901836 RepID=A0ABY4CVV1_9BACL|nr:hypothetical protein LSG31_07180 [Alicyclobacillaceae bacterium MYW30-H2]
MLKMCFCKCRKISQLNISSFDSLFEGFEDILQPQDQGTLKNDCFTNTECVTEENNWGGIKIIRTGGRHGRGEMAQKMGPVSGFVLQAVDEPILYIVGDTIWCPEVQNVLETHQPDVAIVNAGAAQFLTG